MAHYDRFHGCCTGDDTPGCDYPGCEAAGEFRAPRRHADGSVGDIRHNPHHFCLDHVRAYNAQWDYFAGMDEGAIAREHMAAMTWHRPTWRIGDKAALHRINDPFEFFDDDDWEHFCRQSAGDRLSDDDRRALDALGLDDTAEPATIKARYKELARRYHPDTNGGDRRHEAKLRAVIDAYRQLANHQSASRQGESRA